MSSVWAKIDALLPMNPKCYKAGFWGTIIYSNLLLINKAHGCQGMVPRNFTDPEYLARYLQLDTAPVSIGDDGDASHRHGDGAINLVRFGLNQALKRKLIRNHGDRVEIVGWDRSWDKKADSSKKRTRKWRERQAESSRDDGDGVGDGDASQRHGDGVTPRVEEKRIEEIRSDSKEVSGDESPTPPQKKKGLDPDKIPEQAHTLAQLLADHVTENLPTGTLAKLAPAKRRARLLKWANTIRLMRTEDKHSWAQIDSMIAWSQAEPFWSGTITSAEGIRKNWDAMTGQRAGNPRQPNGVDQGRTEPESHAAHEGGELPI